MNTRWSASSAARAIAPAARRIWRDYRLSRSVKLTTGYQYKADQREQADRQDTDEHTLFLKGATAGGALQLGGKLAWSTRDGSDWRHDSAGGNGSPTLRQFYLADRDRVELRGSRLSVQRGWMPASKGGGPGMITRSRT